MNATIINDYEGYTYSTWVLGGLLLISEVLVGFWWHRRRIFQHVQKTFLTCRHTIKPGKQHHFEPTITILPTSLAKKESSVINSSSIKISTIGTSTSSDDNYDSQEEEEENINQNHSVDEENNLLCVLLLCTLMRVVTLLLCNLLRLMLENMSNVFSVAFNGRSEIICVHFGELTAF